MDLNEYIGLLVMTNEAQVIERAVQHEAKRRLRREIEDLERMIAEREQLIENNTQSIAEKQKVEAEYEEISHTLEDFIESLKASGNSNDSKTASGEAAQTTTPSTSPANTVKNDEVDHSPEANLDENQ